MWSRPSSAPVTDIPDKAMVGGGCGASCPHAAHSYGIELRFTAALLSEGLVAQARLGLLLPKEEAMYISVRRYQVEPQTVEDTVRRVEEEFVPIVSQAPDFVAYYAVDAGNGVIASISLFDDPAGADATLRRAAHWVREADQFFPSAPQTTAGAVRVQKHMRV